MDEFGPENRSGNFHRSFTHYQTHDKKKGKVAYYHVVPPGNTITRP